MTKLSSTSPFWVMDRSDEAFGTARNGMLVRVISVPTRDAFSANDGTIESIPRRACPVRHASRVEHERNTYLQRPERTARITRRRSTRAHDVAGEGRAIVAAQRADPAVENGA